MSESLWFHHDSEMVGTIMLLHVSSPKNTYQLSPGLEYKER